MITFGQTLDAVVQIHDLMKSAEEIEVLVNSTSANLKDLQSMLSYAHKREFRNAEDALKYVDGVLLPQLNGIINALDSGTEKHFVRLAAATEHTERLMFRLESVTPGAPEDLPG